MEREQRELWDSILLGNPVAPGQELAIEQLLVGASDEDVRWVLRAFEPVDVELLDRWQRYWTANLSKTVVSDDDLMDLVTRWTSEVARSASNFGLHELVGLCGAAPSFGIRPDRSARIDYLDWVSHVNAALSHTPHPNPGVRELSECYWGATNFHEFVWFLLKPLVELPVDPDASVALLGAGALCWVSSQGVIVERVRQP